MLKNLRRLSARSLSSQPRDKRAVRCRLNKFQALRLEIGRQSQKLEDLAIKDAKKSVRIDILEKDEVASNILYRHLHCLRNTKILAGCHKPIWRNSKQQF
jgi:hypothetical protein